MLAWFPTPITMSIARPQGSADQHYSHTSIDPVSILSYDHIFKVLDKILMVEDDEPERLPMSTGIVPTHSLGLRSYSRINSRIMDQN